MLKKKKKKILISPYKHVIFLLGEVQKPFALGIIAVMCFDMSHYHQCLKCTVVLQCHAPMCYITNPVQHQSITPYNHNTFNTRIL
jgi:hypothetical protein